MIWFGVLVLVTVCFSVVLLVGAPYLPTLSSQQATALELIKLKPGDTLLELGCGDARVVIAAAQKGYKVVGYELNPIMFIVSYLRTIKYRKNVRIIFGNFWSAELPKCKAIYVFLLPKYMAKLDALCSQLPSKPLQLVSIAFEIEDKKPAASRNGVFLYKY